MLYFTDTTKRVSSCGIDEESIDFFANEVIMFANVKQFVLIVLSSVFVGLPTP